MIEHNVEVIKQSDWIVDVGPEAGKNEEQILYTGGGKDLPKTESITTNYLQNTTPQIFLAV